MFSSETPKETTESQLPSSVAKEQSQTAKPLSEKEQEPQSEPKKDKTSSVEKTEEKNSDEELRRFYSYENVDKAFETAKSVFFTYSDGKSGFLILKKGDYYHICNAKTKAIPQAGFKIYVAIDDHDPEDVKKLWVITRDLALKYRLPEIKCVRLGINLARTNKDECGKQVVIYLHEGSTLDWKIILDDYAEMLAKRKFRYSPISPKTKKIDGENCFSFANDQNKQGKYIKPSERKDYNDADAPVPEILKAYKIEMEGYQPVEWIKPVASQSTSVTGDTQPKPSTFKRS